MTTPEEMDTDDPLRAGDLDAALRWVKQARITARTKSDRRVAYMQSRHRALDAMIVTLFVRTLELARELAELKARPAIVDRGIWSPETSYALGDAVTHSGALWIAKITSRGLRPGNGGLGWRLAVKRGKAA